MLQFAADMKEASSLTSITGVIASSSFPGRSSLIIASHSSGDGPKGEQLRLQALVQESQATVLNSPHGTVALLQYWLCFENIAHQAVSSSSPPGQSVELSQRSVCRIHFDELEHRMELVPQLAPPAGKIEDAINSTNTSRHSTILGAGIAADFFVADVCP